MQIYLARNNVQAGPYSLEQVNDMLKSGEVLLTDLAWHEGMKDWEALGILTAGQLSYYPLEPKATRRVSVAELYGTKTDKPDDNKPKNTNPDMDSADWQGRHSKTTVSMKEWAPAPLSSRFLATAINGALFFLALYPLMKQMTGLIDPTKMNAGSLAQRIAYAESLAQKIPQNSVGLSLILLLLLVLVQAIMAVKQGRSLGKLIAGIHVVDEATRTLPSVVQGFWLRGVLVLVVYWVGSFFGANIVLMLINYVMAAFHKDKRGWHDRLAKTIVVAAPKNTKKTKVRS